MKTFNTIIFSLLLTTVLGQVQIGNAINGETKGAWLGYSIDLSLNGERVAITSRLAENQGIIQVFENQNDFWMQVGSNIEFAINGLHPAISLSSNGKRVGIYETGHFKIYEEINEVWNQVGKIFGPNEAKLSDGSSFSLSSDGKRIAIGTPFNEGAENTAGYAVVFEESDGVWNQIGADLIGENPEGLLSLSVSISSDGKRVARGAIYDASLGYVRIYEERDGGWNHIGKDIAIEDPDYRIGVSLSSNGNRIAVKSVDYDTGLEARIRVYEENNGIWESTGMNIKGPDLYDWFGFTFSFSGDGRRIAVGDPGTFFGPIERGYVRIYDENDGVWTPIGMDLEGDNIGDYFGYSVSLSSDKSILAVGSFQGENYEGQVKIYELPLSTSSKTDFHQIDNIGIQVSPNPFNNTILIKAEYNIKSIEITNLSGKVIKMVSSIDEKEYLLNLSTLQKGIYFLRSHLYNATYTNKIIKI